MDKIFEQAKDLHVRKIVVYGKAADGKLYKEANLTTTVAQSEMEDAFTKGQLLVKVGTQFFTPVFVTGNKVNVIVKPGYGAAAFDSTETYAVGEYCTKDGVIYVCSTAISTAAAWDASKWTAADLIDFKEWTTTATV